MGTADLEGRVIGTDETALDDVVGSFVVERGFVYASVDRDGVGGTREGLALTNEFSRVMKEQVEVHLGRKIDRTYLVGLSMVPTVHEAFEALDRWVSEGTVPPADQIVKPGAPLRRP